MDTDSMNTARNIEDKALEHALYHDAYLAATNSGLADAVRHSLAAQRDAKFEEILALTQNPAIYRLAMDIAAQRVKLQKLIRAEAMYNDKSPGGFRPFFNLQS